MADDQDLELNVDEEGESKGSSKLVIIIGVVVLLLVGGGAAFFFMSGGDEEKSDQEEEGEKQKPAIYVPLRPAFVVNFHQRGRQRYLQINVSLMTRESAVTEAVNVHAPLIRSTLVTLFGSQELNELKTPEGKEALRELVLEELNTLLSENADTEGIEQVLFTSFVMQ